jgi:CopG family nickel-responsive transcriptional regulator
LQRITVSLDDALAAELDQVLRTGGYKTRSEGVRDIVREVIEKRHSEVADGSMSVATFSYIYSHRVRSLATILSEMQHAHHDIVVSTTQVHLNHEHSLETIILRGDTAAVRAFAEAVRAERGVRSATLNVVNVITDDRHQHHDDHSHVGHQHLTPIGS